MRSLRSPIREFASRSEPSKKPSDAELLTWLGRKYVNGTFSDEEDVDEIDIQQLKDILNSDSEEPQC